MNREKIFETKEFIEQQLFETQQMLFSARSVREALFLQNKLDYLKQRIREINATNRKSKKARRRK